MTPAVPSQSDGTAISAVLDCVRSVARLGNADPYGVTLVSMKRDWNAVFA